MENPAEPFRLLRDRPLITLRSWGDRTEMEEAKYYIWSIFYIIIKYIIQGPYATFGGENV